MPKPQQWGLNTPVYQGIQHILHYHPRMCIISPNFITLLAATFTIPVMHNFLCNGPAWQLVLWCMLREVLDIADGQTASSCGTTSRTGAILDVTMDAVYTYGVSLAIVYCLWPLCSWVDGGILVLAVVSSVLMSVDMYHEVTQKQRPFTDTIIVRHGVVLVPLLLLCIKLWIMHSRSVQ